MYVATLRSVLRSAVHPPPLARVEALIYRRCMGGLGAAQEGTEQGEQVSGQP